MNPRRHFEERLEELKVNIIRMGGMIEEAVSKAAEAFYNRNRELAQEVIAGDIAIDRLEREIENQCAALIATEQPVALDLRLIIAALKISNDLERTGDYAKHLATVATVVPREIVQKSRPEVMKMAETANAILRESLAAYARRDVALARQAKARDDEVDRTYMQLFQETVQAMKEDPEIIQPAVAVLFVSKYLERLADHATNVADEVIFVCTGSRKEWLA
jgi:phosphate transport system protein